MVGHEREYVLYIDNPPSVSTESAKSLDLQQHVCWPQNFFSVHYSSLQQTIIIGWIKNLTS